MSNETRTEGKGGTATATAKPTGAAGPMTVPQLRRKIAAANTQVGKWMKTVNTAMGSLNTAWAEKEKLEMELAQLQAAQATAKAEGKANIKAGGSKGKAQGKGGNGNAGGAGATK